MIANYWEDCYRDPNNCLLKDYDGWLDGYEILPGCRVLDLGCGAGTNIAPLQARGARVTAADFSANAVHMVQDLYPGLAGADCFDMRGGFPYEDAAFELVISDLTLHYFSWTETMNIIAEIRRVLVPGGRLIARLHSTANLQNPPADAIEENYYMVDGFPRRYFTPADIAALFSEWKLLNLEEKTIFRYNRQKQVIEFSAQKPE